MSDDEDPKTPIDQALDVFVYLPIGFVLEFPRSIPRYIERGRRHFDAVIRIGRETIPNGAPTEQFDRLQAQTRNTLRALGVVSGNGPNGDRARSPFSAPGTSSRSASTASTAASGAPAPVRAADGSDSVADDERSTSSSTASVTSIAAPPEPGIDPDTLAIPDYDSLSASQVVPRLDSLSLDELELVRQYEGAKRGRKTILSKIAQLQAG